jgi:hypothetical protein
MYIEDDNLEISQKKLSKLNLLIAALANELNKLNIKEENFKELFINFEEEFVKLTMVKFSTINFPLKYEIESHIKKCDIECKLQTILDDIEIEKNIQNSVLKFLKKFSIDLINQNIEELSQKKKNRLILRSQKLGNNIIEILFFMPNIKIKSDFQEKYTKDISKINGIINQPNEEEITIKFQTSNIITNILKIRSDIYNFGVPFINIEDFFSANSEDFIQKEKNLYLKHGNELINIFHVDSIIDNKIRPIHASSYNIILLNSVTKKYALIVDNFKGEEKIIKRILSDFFKDYDFIQGYHIDSENKLYWILNIPKLFERIEKIICTKNEEVL